jgi:indolepyruvate ferredoxin oxidoreductase
VSQLLSGVDALVRLLLLRHQLDERDGLTTATMVSGYPGSPLGTFDLTLDAQGPDVLDKHRIVHRPGLNEELAAAIVWGSQLGAVIPYAEVDGVAGAWYGKGPGLDRSGDALKHANSLGAGPNGGAVVFVGDDPSAKSSTLTCDSQYTFQDACIPVLYPGDQQDILDLGVHAFRLSRYSGAWTGLKVVTSVADGIGTVDLDLDRHHPRDPRDVIIDGAPWRHRPLRTVGPHAVPDQEILVADRRLRAAKAYARANGVDRASGAGRGASLGIVCAGKTYFDVTDALARFGAGHPASAGIRVLRLGMTYPLVEETVLDFAASVGEIAVIEEKRPFIEVQLRAILHEAGAATPVTGKRDRAGQPLTPMAGELDADAVAQVLVRLRPDLAPAPPERARLTLLPRAPAPQVPGRSPGYCSGCPHNRSTVLPDGALAGGGVGCHGIMYFEARNAGRRSLPPPPMGAEGVPWIGLQPFVAETHLIQNLGDGTLSHSGTLAIRAAVAAGANITFKILYNATVAMTGGQDVTGLMDVPSLTRALRAEGVAEVVVCAEDPSRYNSKMLIGLKVLGRDALPKVQERLRTIPGVTVIIYDQRCAAQVRRLRKRGQLPEPPRRVIINEAVCEGCGDCGVKSNCLSVLPVSTEFGEKRQVHDPSCNRDYSCIEGDCPSFVTISSLRQPGGATPRHPPQGAARGGSRARNLPPSARPDSPVSRLARPTGVLPAPVAPVVERRHAVYFTGIGGTGVVTASRIIAAIGESAGLAIGGLDQTGLSQKAGAVVSHLHLARTTAGLGASAVGSDAADVYLSGDVLQAAADRHLAKIRPGHTVVVVDPELTPTANMLQLSSGGTTLSGTQGSSPPDVEALKAAITERAQSRVAFVAAKRIAEAAFGDHLLANVVLVGAAYQLGGLPGSLDDVSRAMSRPGTSAAVNREAFEWGRWAVHHPAAVAAALAAGRRRTSPFDPPARSVQAARHLVSSASLPAGLPCDLRDLLTRRAAQAVDYQDARLARRYLGLVARVADGDDAEHGWALTRAVASAWFKLLTYKDEYEVARLHLAFDYDAAARDLGITGGYTLTYHLHPPVLRRLGLKRKLPMGKPYALAFRVLVRMKRLRGTPFDIFGRDPDRRMERALITEYQQLIEGAGGLPYDEAVRLAQSVLSVTGYGPVKEAAVGRWRAGVARHRAQAADPVGADP